MPLPKGTPFARGHSPRLPVGRPPRDSRRQHPKRDHAGRWFCQHGGGCRPLLRATGAQCKRSVLSAASRHEMTRRHWRPHSSIESYYGLGISIGNRGQAGTGSAMAAACKGTSRKPASSPHARVTISVLTNATDGYAGFWADGAMRILRIFEARGAPKRRVRDWTRRWWSSWGPFDLVPMGTSCSPATRTLSTLSWIRRNRAHRPRHRPHLNGHRSRKLRRSRAPHPQQGRQGHRRLVRGRQRAAGEKPWRQRWSEGTDGESGARLKPSRVIPGCVRSTQTRNPDPG